MLAVAEAEVAQTEAAGWRDRTESIALDDPLWIYNSYFGKSFFAAVALPHGGTSDARLIMVMLKMCVYIILKSRSTLKSFKRQNIGPSPLEARGGWTDFESGFWQQIVAQVNSLGFDLGNFW